MNGSRRRLVGSLAAALVVAGASAWGWRTHVRTEILRGSIPARPASTSLPPEFAQRATTGEQLVQRGPNGVAALAELGQLYHANGFLPEAVTCYRGLLQLEPANGRWPHRLACIYAGFGQLEEARQLWERTIRVAPEHLPARVRLGDVLLKLNRANEASAAYRAALARDARNAYALVGLARLDVAAQRWPAARERLEQAAAASQGRVGADLLATVCEQQGDAARAAELRAQAKSSGVFHDPPDAWLDEIFDDCFDVYRLTVAAGFANHAGDRAAARRWIDRALQFAPDHAPALYQRGSFAMARRDYDRARLDFEACVRAAPEFSDGWLRLVEVHVATGNVAGAERALETGLARCPTSAALHLERAKRWQAAGRLPGALAEFETASRLRPTDAEALIALANILFRLERVEQGVAALQRALVAEPEHPMALATLTLHAIQAGNEAAAREWLQRVRAQVRTPRKMVDGLVGEYRGRFGRAP
jgi:tetratricopeptide (TPR) repeat protein